MIANFLPFVLFFFLSNFPFWIKIWIQEGK